MNQNSRLCLLRVSAFLWHWGVGHDSSLCGCFLLHRIWFARQSDFCSVWWDFGTMVKLLRSVALSHRSLCTWCRKPSYSTTALLTTPFEGSALSNRQKDDGQSLRHNGFQASFRKGVFQCPIVTGLRVAWSAIWSPVVLSTAAHRGFHTLLLGKAFRTLAKCYSKAKMLTVGARKPCNGCLWIWRMIIPK